MLFYHLSLVENEFRDSFRHFYTASSSKIRRVCTSMYSYTPTVPPAHIPVLYTVPGTLENNPRSLATPYLFYSVGVSVNFETNLSLSDKSCPMQKNTGKKTRETVPLSHVLYWDFVQVISAIMNNNNNNHMKIQNCLLFFIAHPRWIFILHPAAWF